ncbi:ZIP family metal transporter [Streptomyces sp. NPDC057376]|uniref:ZIP family metal transporter n=1 Tax=unclassified Streptomyces TaxID=2593676 RepID=UPI000ABBE6F5|nr:ZIP family metal transporter [Streptomyces sp. CB02414]
MTTADSTASLVEITGARQELTIVLPARLRRVPDWSEGPFPFELGSRRTDTPTRSTYFAPASARALYGAPGRPRRWHLPLDVKHDGLRLLGVELLRAATARDPEHALAVLHFSVERPLLPVLRTLAGRGFATTEEPLTGLTGPFDPALLLDGIADVRNQSTPFAISRPYTIAFLTPTAHHTPALRDGREGELPATADRWLWQLASRSTPQDFPLAPETAAEHLRDAVRISADWSALVLRQGAAFLGHRPDTGEGDFYGFGALHARTVYLDALLLGALQRDHIDELTDELSEVFSQPRHLARRVAALERNIAHFRSGYWRQHLTAHGPANELLLAFQNQHRLPARFNEILAEAADYSRLVQTQESQQISGTLGVLTILGLPLGTALGILQVLDDKSPSHLLIALALSIAATAGVLTTRYGRLVLSSLRGGEGRQ